MLVFPGLLATKRWATDNKPLAAVLFDRDMAMKRLLEELKKAYGKMPPDEYQALWDRAWQMTTDWGNFLRGEKLAMSASNAIRKMKSRGEVKR
jgi:hypothetical protein